MIKIFHTICLFKRLSFDEYRLIDNVLPQFSNAFLVKEIPCTGNPNKYVFRRYGFAHFKWLEGVSMYLTKKKNYLDKHIVDTKLYLHMVINPKVILNKDYISVANQWDGVFALHEIDRLFHRMAIPLTCANFQTSRIDCCFNYQFFDMYGNPSDMMAQNYLKTLGKCKIPPKFILARLKNSLVYTQSYYNQKSPDRPIKYVVVNIYSKHGELKRKVERSPCLGHSNDEVDDAEFLETLNYEYERDSGTTLANARGIVRFEVQLYYQKLYNTTRSTRWGFNSLDINHFISDHFTESMLIEYLEKISFEGNFFTLDIARELVNNYHISHKKTKERLLTLLAQVSKHKGWNNAAESVNKELSSNTVKTVLNWFDKIGINPVTLPSIKDGGSWGSNYFPSPITIVKNAIQNNTEQNPYEIVALLMYDD